MKSTKKLFVSIVIAFIFAIIAPNVVPLSTNITTVEAAKVKISKSKSTLIKGQSLKLKIKNTSKKVKWSSSDSNVATVNSSGKVKAKKAGTVKVTGKVGKKEYSCKITVETPKIDETSLTLVKGESSILSILDTTQKVKWTTSNSKIVSVNRYGHITAKKKGKATITASIGGKKYKCIVTVKNTFSVGTISNPISAFNLTTLRIANYGATKYKKAQLQLKEVLVGSQAEAFMTTSFFTPVAPAGQQWVYLRFNIKYISNTGYSSSDELYNSIHVAGNHYLSQVDLLGYSHIFDNSYKLPVENYNIKYGYINDSTIPNIYELRLEPSESSDFYILFTAPKSAFPLTYRIPTGFDRNKGKTIYTWFTTQN